MAKNQEKKQSKKDAQQIVPLGDRVLVQPLQVGDEKTLASGIIIPDTAEKEKPSQGTVVAVGPGRIDEHGKRVPMQVAKGDRIVFSKYGYDEIEIDDEDYYIVSESNIVAIIK